MDIRFVPLGRKRQISADVVHTHDGMGSPKHLKMSAGPPNLIAVDTFK